MPRVILWVEDAVAPATAQMVSAFQRAVRLAPSQGQGFPDAVTVLDPGTWPRYDRSGDREAAADFFLPLTLHLPPGLDFPASALYATCREVIGLRQRVAQWGYATGDGRLTLPIVLTAKGPLYAEVIGPAPDAAALPGAATLFVQPVDFSDARRQPLYALGQRLLRSLIAPPAVYLLQFSVQGEHICFDRLLPFPDERAIASLNIQTPDLFTCHWLCTTSQPIHDLII